MQPPGLPSHDGMTDSKIRSEAPTRISFSRTLRSRTWPRAISASSGCPDRESRRRRPLRSRRASSGSTTGSGGRACGIPSARTFTSSGSTPRPRPGPIREPRSMAGRRASPMFSGTESSSTWLRTTGSKGPRFPAFRASSFASATTRARSSTRSTPASPSRSTTSRSRRWSSRRIRRASSGRAGRRTTRSSSTGRPATT